MCRELKVLDTGKLLYRFQDTELSVSVLNAGDGWVPGAGGSATLPRLHHSLSKLVRNLLSSGLLMESKVEIDALVWDLRRVLPPAC